MLKKQNPAAGLTAGHYQKELISSAALLFLYILRKLNYKLWRYSCGVTPYWRLNCSRKLAGVKPTAVAMAAMVIEALSRSRGSASSIRILLMYCGNVRQQVVERMTGDTETCTDVLTLKRNIGIEMLCANGSIDCFKESRGVLRLL